jgi:hypothetical protein
MSNLIPHKHTGLDSPKLKTTDITTTDGNAYLKDTDAMHITGVESVGGIKTFSSIPVLPASDPTTDNQIARKAYVDTFAIDSTISATNDWLIDSADTEQCVTQFQSSWTKKKDITFNETDGTIRVKFDLKDNDGAGIIKGKVYVNDVAVGTEQTETAGSWATKTEDFSVETGDRVQLKMSYDNSGGGTGGCCRNFRLYYTRALNITAGTVNLD